MSARGKSEVNGMISSSIPYSVHSVLESSKVSRLFVCLGSRRPAYMSIFSEGAVHLIITVSGVTEIYIYLLGTPALHDTRKHNLLRVISDEGN
jgi:hypothetical protein